MRFRMPPLYPILDERFFPEGEIPRSAFLDRTVRELADSGVTLLQLREKNGTREQIMRDAVTVRRAAGSGMRLILNDYAELVRETGFDGVHLGQNDLAIRAARLQLGPGCILGFSTHTPQGTAQGDLTDVNYLVAGPVFATASKADTAPVIGLEGVRAARLATGKPLVAIGGIGFAQVESVWAAGADSVAVIGALFAAGRSPGTIAQDFLRLFR